MRRNLDTVKTFFDPHPGFAGAAIPIPSAVKKAANELNGESMSLHKAVAKLQAVTDGKVSVNDGWIALELRESDGARHIFRVIRFR
ncbi:MAG: hypothetical protein Q8R36_05270 [bacterium]|nr:hypothetical protein [bacterium]